MRVLIVEDDFTNRKVLLKYLQPYGDCDVAVDGTEAFTAFQNAFSDSQLYDLICLDIMMPHLDGHGVLRQIREFEEARGIHAAQGVKIIMTTALDDSRNVLGAFKEGCEAYIVKPIEKHKLLNEIRKLGLLAE